MQGPLSVKRRGSRGISNSSSKMMKRRKKKKKQKEKRKKTRGEGRGRRRRSGGGVGVGGVGKYRKRTFKAIPPYIQRIMLDALIQGHRDADSTDGGGLVPCWEPTAGGFATGADA